MHATILQEADHLPMVCRLYSNMVSVHGYNKEKKAKGFTDVYMMAIAFAVVAVFVFIGGLHLLLITINFAIKNWVWVLVGAGVLVVVFKFLTSKRVKHE